MNYNNYCKLLTINFRKSTFFVVDIYPLCFKMLKLILCSFIFIDIYFIHFKNIKINSLYYESTKCDLYIFTFFYIYIFTQIFKFYLNYFFSKFIYINNKISLILRIDFLTS